MSDDVRQAARALDAAVTRLSHAITFAPGDVDGARTEAYRAQDALRAALASAERGVPVAWSVFAATNPVVAFASRLRDDCERFASQCQALAPKGGPYRVVPLYAAPAENDAGRGE